MVTGPAVRKDELTDSSLELLGPKIDIGFVTNRHHMAPNQLLKKRFSMVFRRASLRKNLKI
jgi:hypothetical protein